MSARAYLAVSLLALAALYGAWYGRGVHALAGLLVFSLPPLLLALSAFAGWRRAGFLSAVLALAWFSHGVMLAWSEPGQRMQASLAVLLSLAIIHAACLPGIRARRARGKGQ